MDAGSVIRWRTRLGKSAMAGLASGLRGNDMNLRSRKAALSIVLGVVAPTVGASDAMAWDGKTYVLSYAAISSDSKMRMTGWKRDTKK